MDRYIKDMFEEHYPIQITKKLCNEVLLYCTKFETRGTHPLALNTQAIATQPLFFTTKDQDVFFEIFNIDKKILSDRICKIKTIEPKFRVSSDALNMFLIWVTYKGFTSAHLNSKEQYELAFTTLKILHYKFFTSFVNHMLPHGADEATMDAIIEGLNRKFDIVVYGTWKNVIEARVNNILEKKSIHFNTINTFTDDNAVKFIITDIQTNIKNKLKIIISLYRDAKSSNRGKAISSYTTINTIDGEKIFTNTGIAYDSMITGVMTQVLNTKTFVNMDIVKPLANEFSSITPNMLKSMLTAFSILAISQAKDGTLDYEKEIITEDRVKLKIYVGLRKLITELIQKSYRSCLQDKVNMRSKKAIYTKIKNLYTASRVMDNEVLVIKESMMNVVEMCGTYTRISTKASLRIAIILYLIIKSMDYLK